MSDHVHQWRLRGDRDVHVHVPDPKTPLRAPVIVSYVVCACGQVGFRRPYRNAITSLPSQVVYTWEP